MKIKKIMHKQLWGLPLLKIGFCFIFLTLLILILPSVKAGCCFDSGLGTCSASSDENSCTSLGGEFFGGTCSVVDVCQEGCCILGANTQHVSSGVCEVRSKQQGFNVNFQAGVSADDCSLLAKTQEKGACLSGNIKPYNCVFTTKDQCPSQFYAGASCTNPELNTTCKKTTNTMCYDEKLYSQDSCGNPDAVTDNCDFASGKICKTTNSKSAYCKDLNCGDKKNGESWCVDACYNEESPVGGVGLIDIVPDRTPEGGCGNAGWVGSRYFTQYCLDGEITTEPCSDFKADTCSSDGGQATCVANPWQQCIAANAGAESNGNSGSSGSSSGSSSSENSGISGDCSSDYCTTIDGWGGADSTRAGSTTNSAGKRSYTSTDRNYCSSVDTKTQIEDMAKKTALCVPNVPGGLQFYPASGSSSSDLSSLLSSSSSSNFNSQTSGASTAQQVCGLGNFEATAVFVEKVSCSNNLLESTVAGAVVGAESSAGILTVPGAVAGASSSEDSCTTTRWCTTKGADSSTGKKYGITAGGCIYFDECLWVKSGEVKPAVNILDWLNERCHALGDCDAKTNWVKVSSGPSAGEGNDALQAELVKSVAGASAYKLTYTCEPFQAPGGGEDCKLCGTDGLDCSEYRCRALGDSCEFKNVEGKGYCVASDDTSPPTINLDSITPASPIPPYSAVEIKISTDKFAACKFNLDNSGSKYDDMKQDFGSGYGLNHTTTLYLPGQKIEKEDGSTQYSLITKNGGNYSLYVRCKDVAGNWNAAAKLIQFQVMNTPDTSIIDPKNFAPVSGSKIAYKTTEKAISFTMDEPVECHWDFSDENFSSMQNNFSCSDAASNYTIIHGYGCSGILTNVTLNLNSQSKYYIRCKDQPELGNDTITIKGVNYTRNEMDHSYVYSLQPSEKLNIVSISPSGQIFVGGNNLSVELEAVTSGGSLNGMAKCYWKHSNETYNFGVGYYNFARTNSFEHSQTLTSPTVGNNFITIKCTDSAGNVEYENSTFNLQIDTTPPMVARMYATENQNQLIIKTIEDAICYFSFDKNQQCSFKYPNSTMMDGVEKDHTAQWKYDTTYYIKCKDYRRNQNTGNCAAMIRTY